jgi:uncharacterized membrane protein
MRNAMKTIRAGVNRYALWGIFLGAFLLRWHTLDATDFWYDEAFTGVAIHESFHAMLAMIIQDVHPPLYYIVLQAFVGVFGYTVWSVRFFSLIFGMLGIGGIYLFARELSGRRAAFFATIIAALSPFAIQYAQEGRMYMMLSSLLIFGSYFFLRGLREGRRHWYILWGICVGLGALTHYMAIIFAPLFLVVAILWRYHTEPERYARVRTWGRLLWPSANIFLGYGVSFLIFVPWIGEFFRHMRMSRLDWIRPATLSDIFLNLQIFLFGIPRGQYSGMPGPNELRGIANPTIFVLLAILTAFVIVFLWRRERFQTSVLVTFSFGFMLTLYGLSLAGMPYLVARYVILSAYFFFILIGLWLSLLRPRWAMVCLVGYIGLLALIIPVTYNNGFNQLSQHIHEYDGRNIYVLNSFDYVIAKSYFGADRLVLYNIDWPQYDSSIWAAIGSSLHKTESFETLKNDPDGLILFNTAARWQDRNDKSFDPSKFEWVATYGNISLYTSNPKVFFR